MSGRTSDFLPPHVPASLSFLAIDCGLELAFHAVVVASGEEIITGNPLGFLFGITLVDASGEYSATLLTCALSMMERL